jgi:hypothetical protein
VPITRHDEFQEETSRQFWSLDEEWEQHVALAHRLPKREALIRVYNRPVIHVVTPEVESEQKDGRWERFQTKVSERCRYVTPVTVVVREIGARRQELTALTDETETAGRPFDVKSFREEFYKKICGGRLKDVKQTVEISADYAWLEVATLIIPGLNDSDEEIDELSEWLASIRKNIPLHLSRYFPRYKMTREATDIDLIKRARDAAREYLRFVYIGNIEGVDDNTYCPKCHELLVEREYYDVKNHMTTDQCPKCGEKIPIIL